MKKISIGLVSAGALVMPLLALAQVGGPLTELVTSLQNILKILLPTLMVLALVVFIWGLVQYIWSAGNPDAASKGKSIMIWGVIALFVMSAIWGITGALARTFGVDNGDAPNSGDLTPR